MSLLSRVNPFARWRDGKIEPVSLIATPPPAAAPPATTASPSVDAFHLPFVAWLLGLPTSVSSADRSAGKALLRHLDAVIAAKTSLASLLPRAAHLVPQLMKSLRNDAHSTTEMAQRISQDVVLTTEVLRVANSAGYAGRPPLTDVADAVAALGVDGLQRAIARVLLRPMFEQRSEPFSRVAAPHIWQDAETKAKACMGLASEHGADMLDAYLAGMLHGIGWTAALRTLDESPLPGMTPQTLLHPDTALALFKRRDALFGRIVAPWHISPGLTALATELAADGLAAAASPLARVLQRAEVEAMAQALRLPVPPRVASP